MTNGKFWTLKNKGRIEALSSSPDREPLSLPQAGILKPTFSSCSAVLKTL
jgi:hypothetical protein